MFPDEMRATATALLDAYREAGLRVVTAESCTGGLIAGLLTDIAGSSSVVERGFVTYSNEAKSDCLGVPPAILDAHGAVSAETARAMAVGALGASRADVSIAVTGIAGPGGGSVEKPVGLVHLACARRGGAVRHLEMRYGDLGRSMVRLRTVADALGLLEAALGPDHAAA
ncbi:CinA family protein [Salinarimonas sp. NSM]|uniref:CinA family protein n=1 Tax=Salinarimonas sp. NSM TaxID=3458003 RepID=UPI0040356521